MCLPKTPKAPAPPPPPAPPPQAPTEASPSVKAAKSRTRSAAFRAQGRSSTLLGGSLAGTPQNVSGKTLLGA